MLFPFLFPFVVAFLPYLTALLCLVLARRLTDWWVDQ